ncbi:MAG: tetratricopeptide repeat protein, partial [Taibaiella sp.]|nr:tetratricopeptide repeat protein [Taibaiella sp.]
YQRAGEKKKATAAFEKLLSMYGNDEEILEGKLQLHLNNNELEEAVKVNNRLIEIAPNESKYYVRLAEMYNNNGQPDKAAEVYKTAEEMFPDDAGIQLSLSDYYKRKGDKENYVKYLRKVVINNSLEASEQLTILAGFVMSAEDSTDKALGLDLAKEIAQQNPNDPRALAAYGDMLGITDNPAAAAEQYKKSVEIEPAAYVVWKNLLSVYLQVENYDSVLKYSDRALRLFPNQAQLHYINGLAYSLKKDYNKAINSLERAVDMMPEENKGELAGMYGTLADAYYNVKDYQSSDEYFEKSLELAPDNPTTLNNYAYYLSERGEKLDKAEEMSKRSLELAPDLPTFMDTYGWIMYKKGNYKKAREYIEKAIQKEEQEASGTLWDHLGDIDYKLGDKDKALENWKKAKELGADNPNLDKKIADKKLYE